MRMAVLKQMNTAISLLLILFMAQSSQIGAESHASAVSVMVVVAETTGGGGGGGYRPVMEGGMVIKNIEQVYQIDQYQYHHGITKRRKLGGPFQVCLVCKCCVNATDATTCVNMPCCFGIDCQLPNKPFGVCAFVPKICNCATCN